MDVIRPLFAEHHFITILCAFFAVMMTLSFYRFLRSINPALVAFIFVLIFGLLFLHWTVTRSEPAFLTPVVEKVAPFFPSAPRPRDGGVAAEKKSPPPPAKK
ncbi:MAG: hypothetical protein RLZZ15_142 [Verrucomicrobiota bacterium]